VLYQAVQAHWPELAQPQTTTPNPFEPRVMNLFFWTSARRTGSPTNFDIWIDDIELVSRRAPETAAPLVGRFLLVVDQALQEIQTSPNMFPRWERDARFRKFVMQRFPYIVFYRELADSDRCDRDRA